MHFGVTKRVRHAAIRARQTGVCEGRSVWWDVSSAMLMTCLLIVLLGGCGVNRQGIADLDRLPQRVAAYLPERAQAPLVSDGVQQVLYGRYLDHFFSPWTLANATVPENHVYWGEDTFGKRTGYGENLQPWTLPQWEALLGNQMRSAYPSMARRAIVTRNASFRVMPTERPFFYSPSKAGEGYPFDYMQNSAVWLGTPLLITHMSADGMWYFAQAGMAYGWLPADTFGWVDEAFAANYENGTYAAILRDSVPLRTVLAYVGRAHVGSVFPVVPPQALSAVPCVVPPGIRVMVPVRTPEGSAQALQVQLPASVAAQMPLSVTAQQIATLADVMVGQPYGWGGYLENRDCSSTMRDLLTPFGLWLPRNSSQQGRQVGTSIPLNGLSAGAKRDTLLERGTPFYTLIWFKGHIGLYLGPDAQSGEPLMLHNVWGARTEWDGVEGRAIVGKLAVTTLRFAEERDDVREDWLYDRMQGIVLLPSDTEADRLPEAP